MGTPKEHVKKALEANLSPQLPKSPPGSPAQRTLFQSWLAIPRKTRLVMSCILFGSAAAGLYISDRLQRDCPYVVTIPRQPSPPNAEAKA